MMEFSDQDGVIVEIAAPVVSGAGVGGRGAGGAGGGGGAGELGRRLLAAARAGDTPAVLELMAAGAAFTADWLGTSPLHAAAAGAHHDTAAVLLRAGVSRDARTKVERTPLHDACAAGHARVARLLLAHGADPRAADMLRMTPLHWAAERGHGDVVRLLLRHGADPAARSKFMLTARELAARRGHRDLVHLLEEAERSASRPPRDLSPDDDPLSTPDRSESPPRLTPAPPPAPAPAPARGGAQHQRGARTIGTERIEIKVEKPEPGGATAGRGTSGAAALLRAHGITLLPPDAGSTVLTALQSGRSVVLSDAGKLMLKESVAPAIVPAGGGGGTTTPPPRGGGGVVLRARQVRAAPPAGVKVFTVNNARAVTKDPATTIVGADTKKTGSQDVQIKYVQLGVGGGGVVGKKLAPGGGGGSAPAAVKFIMHKANFDKIIQQQGGDVTVVAPTDTQSSGQQSQPVAAQLAVAQRTIATLSADLKQTKDDLNLTKEELKQTRNELKQTQKQLREYQDNEILK